MLRLIIQFLVSGTVVCLASLIAPKLGQKWAGLIVAAPLLTVLTFIFLSLNPSSGNLHDYLKSALIFMIPAALFIGSLLLFSSRLHFATNILISFCGFTIAVLCIYKLRLV